MEASQRRFRDGNPGMSVGICHRCNHRQRPCSGPCPCTVDGRDIIEHADAEYCPERKFGNGVKPAGWADGPAAKRMPGPVVLEAPGPGDVVKRVLARLGYASASSCGCATMRRQMNQWGWWGCWKHRAELVAWFSEKAREQNIEVTPQLILRLLREAWRELRPPVA